MLTLSIVARPLGARALSRARFAVSVAICSNRDVLRRSGMAVPAMGLTAFPCRVGHITTEFQPAGPFPNIAAFHIPDLRHGLKMMRIHATGHFTAVVKHHSFWNVSHEKLVGNAMRTLWLSIQRKLAVPMPADRRIPNPASAGWFKDDFFQKSLFDLVEHRRGHAYG